MRTFLAALLVGTACILAAPTSLHAAPAQTGDVATASNTNFSCTGPVHAQAISLWERSARPYFGNQIDNDLNKIGDVYVLYNTQEELQSFVEMTRRCKDVTQINEIAETLNPAFASLRPLPEDPATKGWVCTGGHTCTAANKLLGHEVQLCSAQFLGLLGAVATDIVENVPASQRTAVEKSFLINAASTMAVQVNHWLSPAYFAHVTERTGMTPASVRDASSKYFFEDRDLWFMTTLSDLSELHEANVGMNAEGTAAFRQLQAKRGQIAGMFNLFLERITIINTANGPRATIDRGYWRDYADNKYALYSTPTSPVLCRKNMLGRMQKTLRVQAETSFIDPNIGWDISHARRLVPALNTFVRNKANIAKVFGYANSKFEPASLQRAFANQIVEKIWNRNSESPLFSNFWDGSNGWYRSGYDNGTGQCMEGEAPYSLTWSFPTGGYPQWGAFNSTIQTLSRRLYQLFNAPVENSASFVNRYYTAATHFQSKEPQVANGSTVWLLTILSDLVAT